MKIIKKREKESRAGFFSGVCVLTLSTLIVKGIGVFFKIPMIRIVGIEGMGYFNAAYHFFGLLLTLSSAGIPVAVSILVSRETAEGRLFSAGKIYRTSLWLFGALGAFLSALMFFFSGEIASLMGMEKADNALRSVSPSVFLLSLSGVTRGYLQGCGKMYPTAVSEVAEAGGKLVFGLLLAGNAIKKGRQPEEVAAAAIFGISAGVLLGTVYLLLEKHRQDRRHTPGGAGDYSESGRHFCVIELIRLSFPITLGASVLSLTSLLDTLIITNSLVRSGMSYSLSVSLYSTYVNLALPMFSFPAAFMLPISMALVPNLASAVKTGNRECEERVRNAALRLVGIIAFPAAFGMCVLSLPILETVFGDAEGATHVAAPLLSVLSASVFFSCLMTVTNSILQAYGRERIPIFSLTVGAAVKVVSETLLISIPGINIFGAPISTFLCSLTVIMLNLRAIFSLGEHKKTPIALFLPSMLSGMLSAISGLMIQRLLSEFMPQGLSTILAISASAAIYLVFVLKSGALTREDILLFPFGERLYGCLKYIKLVK